MHQLVQGFLLAHGASAHHIVKQAAEVGIVKDLAKEMLTRNRFLIWLLLRGFEDSLQLFDIIFGQSDNTLLLRSIQDLLFKVSKRFLFAQLRCVESLVFYRGLVARTGLCPVVEVRFLK